jgi:antitoxin MazE
MPNLVPLGQRVIAAFGGLVKMSRATGWPVSTIESWKSKDSIPRWRLQDIRNAAQANRVTLPDDFPISSSDRAHLGKPKKRNASTRAGRARFHLSESPKEIYAAAPAAMDRPLVSYVKKMGDNYALLMSRAIVESAGLAEGSRVEIEPIGDGRLVVARSKRHFTLDELLAGMTPEREHPLEDDAPRGEETL